MSKKKSYKTPAKNSGWKALAILQAIISIALAVVIVCAVGSEGFTNKNIKTWFKKDIEQQLPAEPADGDDVDDEGKEPNNSEDNENWNYDVSGGEAVLSVNSFVVSSPVVDDEPIFNLAVAPLADAVEQAESSATITAKLSPSVGVVNWSVDFKDPESNWVHVHGNLEDYYKIATDYVVVTPTSGNSCRVDCLKAFGEQIIITATLVEDSNVTATCTADYKQKITGISPMMRTNANGRDYNLLGSQAFFNEGAMPDVETQIRYKLGDGTIKFAPDSANLKLYVKISETFCTYFNGALKNNPSSVGEVGAKDWKLVNETIINGLNDKDGEYYHDFYVYKKIFYSSINSAYLYSRLYEAMFDKENNGLNSNVNYFLMGLSGCTMLYGEGKSSDLMDLRFVLTADGQTFEYETKTYVTTEYIIANSITLDKDSIVF